MQITDWIPPLTTTVLFSAVVWLARNFITTRLTQSVQFEFEKKIEAVRSEQRISEESFKALLREQESEITSLRSSAISGIANTQLELYRRKLQATEQLWNAVNVLAGAKIAVQQIAILKIDAISERVGKDIQLREFVEAMSAGLEPEKLATPDATKAQPFVSDIAWALFVAFQAVLVISVTQLKMLKTGIDPRPLLDHGSVAKLAKVALPHWADFIEKHGLGGYPALVDELQRVLLIELKKMLEGIESDKASLERAFAIQEQVKQVKDSSAIVTANMGRSG